MIETANNDEVAIGDNLNFSGILQDGIDTVSSILPVKKRKQLILPNSLQPPAIDKSQILLQISFLRKASGGGECQTGGEGVPEFDGEQFDAVARSCPDQNENATSSDDLIVCLNNKMADVILDADGRIKNKNQEITVGNASANAQSLFPAGGPHQTTWLDLRDIYGFGVSGFGKGSTARLVEIGVLDLSKAFKKG